jgi:hypothetical protein
MRAVEVSQIINGDGFVFMFPFYDLNEEEFITLSSVLQISNDFYFISSLSWLTSQVCQLFSVTVLFHLFTLY